MPSCICARACRRFTRNGNRNEEDIMSRRWVARGLKIVAIVTVVVGALSFVAMSLDQGKAQDAARVLSRAAAGAKEAAIRGRICRRISSASSRVLSPGASSAHSG